MRTPRPGLHMAVERVAGGASSRSPAREAPPPTTTTSGSRTLTRAAMPIPSHCPTSTRTPRDTASPACAASVTIDPVIAADRPRSSGRGEVGAARPPRPLPRVMALPLPSCSQHPRFPHPHSGLSGSTTMCPISAANPPAPRYRRPSSTIPPPMPVPTPTRSNERRAGRRRTGTRPRPPRCCRCRRPRAVAALARHVRRAARRATRGSARTASRRRGRSTRRRRRRPR